MEGIFSCMGTRLRSRTSILELGASRTPSCLSDSVDLARHGAVGSSDCTIKAAEMVVMDLCLLDFFGGGVWLLKKRGGLEKYRKKAPSCVSSPTSLPTCQASLWSLPS